MIRGLLILCILLTACRSTDIAERRALPRVQVTSQLILYMPAAPPLNEGSSSPLVIGIPGKPE